MRAARRLGILSEVTPVRQGRICIPAPSAAALALGVIAFAALGCGETVIDSTKAEEATQASLEGSLHEKIASVECPSGQKVEPGKHFGCTVDFSNGSKETVILKIRNKDADVSIVGLETSK
jgi:Domain of unknown function (DUF4333)